MAKDVRNIFLDLCIEHEVTLYEFYFIKEYIEDQLSRKATIKKEPHNVGVTVQLGEKSVFEHAGGYCTTERTPAIQRPESD
ncbi:hypothetical protein [Culicoidibacter larvae]|uniref:Uncharacterized protein n=1 Tax=Culicoidibacter larvae TaxID=2579976 RepID=A0A5R8Q9P9_9FIRM|nr:hypothetical protein [Culicoidibacter larvae]TLG72089.1 hypothetical protein FEZ08_09660 [Culicoidibacter larvae]